MALVKCDECGADVSTKATRCPSCGALRRRVNGCGLAMLLGFALLILGGAFYFPSFGPPAGKEASKAAVHANPPDGSVQQVVEQIRKQLRFPASYGGIEWGPLEKQADDTFKVKHIYRAKDDAGDYVVKKEEFHLTADGSLLSRQDY